MCSDRKNRGQKIGVRYGLSHALVKLGVAQEQDHRTHFSPRLARNYTIECEQEDDGQWLAEVLELPGVLTCGASQDEAIVKTQTLALQIGVTNWGQIQIFVNTPH